MAPSPSQLKDDEGSKKDAKRGRESLSASEHFKDFRRLSKSTRCSRSTKQTRICQTLSKAFSEDEGNFEASGPNQFQPEKSPNEFETQIKTT